MTPDNPFDGGRPRPIATVLDALRARIDAERFDAAVVWLEAVTADLGYGDVRPLPGAVAWLGELRAADKKIALAASGERARAAVELAGVAELFDAIVTGPRNSGTLAEAAAELGVEPGDAILIDVAPAGPPGGPRGGLRPPDRRRPQPGDAGGPAPGGRRHGRRRPAGAARLRPRPRPLSDVRRVIGAAIATPILAATPAR